MHSHKLPAALLALALATGAANAEETRLDTNRMFGSGAEAWTKVCAQCHSGREDSVGPNLLEGEYDRDVIHHFARNGSGPMPAFTAAMMDDATLDQIAAYIIENHKESAE